jgi:hypothetical protein
LFGKSLNIFAGINPKVDSIRIEETDCRRKMIPLAIIRYLIMGLMEPGPIRKPPGEL